MKPVFVLYYNVSNKSNRHAQESLQCVSDYIEKKLTDFTTLVIATKDKTSAQMFYPQGKEETIDFMDEIAKKTSFKNIRLKFGEEWKTKEEAEEES